MRENKLKIAFVALVFALLLVPLVAIPVAPFDESVEKQQLASWPSVTNSDGSFNTAYLQQAGNWLTDHFAFRQQLITANAEVQAKVFGVSSSGQVLMGTDGWLYYAVTKDGYQRTNVMSDRAVDNAAYNMKLMQEYVTQGVKAPFAVTIAPNKNSLYPQNMPAHVLPGEGPTSVQKLAKAFEKYKVNYVDMFAELSSHDEVLYYKTDTHWLPEGARIGYNALMKGLGVKGFNTFEKAETAAQDKVTDLEEMLFPLAPVPEKSLYYPASREYRYTNGATQVEDDQIKTSAVRPTQKGAVLIYRDSFGNDMLPFFASTFETGVFSKMVPYSLAEAFDASGKPVDYVVVERVERHLDMLAQDPPIMPALARTGLKVSKVEKDKATAQVGKDGGYTLIRGTFDEAYAQDGQGIYLVVKDSEGKERWFEAFHISAAGNDNGYLVRLVDSMIPEGSAQGRVVIQNDGACTELLAFTIK